MATETTGKRILLALPVLNNALRKEVKYYLVFTLKALHAVHFCIVIISLICQQNAFTQNNTCIIINTLLHVSALIAPSSGTTVS